MLFEPVQLRQVNLFVPHLHVTCFENHFGGLNAGCMGLCTSYQNKTLSIAPNSKRIGLNWNGNFSWNGHIYRPAQDHKIFRRRE